MPRLTLAAVLLLLAGCSTAPRVGDRLARRGDEIVIAGQYFHTGAPVILWTDPGGYDAYRVERRFAKLDQADWGPTQTQWQANKVSGTPPTPNRYGTRWAGLTDEEKEQVRGGGWTLAQLQDRVDQFVLHYDVCGTSKQCFNILHDHRCLSVHFMIDLDGTIYQTLDVKERAWHATVANDRAVGVEIANIGAYPVGKAAVLDRWYAKDPTTGRTIVTIPDKLGVDSQRTNVELRPARDEPITAEIQGQAMVMYDLTPQQYASLARLTATLSIALPKIKLDYPRDAAGDLIPKVLPADQFQTFQGVLGHYHIQDNKQDPGPALNWPWLIDEARRLRGKRPRTEEVNTPGATPPPSSSPPPATSPPAPTGPRPVATGEATPL